MYGTGWFEPFSHQRVSFNTLFVLDPLFSLWPGLACIVLLITRKYDKKRKMWWRLGLGAAFTLLTRILWVTKHADPLVFNDLLFGQVAGWYNRRTKFVSRFYFRHKDDNQLRLQRGRLEGWDQASIKHLITRIWWSPVLLAISANRS